MKKAFYKNLVLEVFDSVYEPSDDSFLLADSVSEKDCKDKNVLDLGCGTGIQGINALSLGAKTALFADINKAALENAKANAVANKVVARARFKKTDLFSALKGKRLDLVFFNPPYVESGKEKKLVYTDGGKKGRELLDCFLKQAKRFLKKKGTLFFLQSSLNGEKKTKRVLKENGFVFVVVARKRIFFEELIVFRAWVGK